VATEPTETLTTARVAERLGVSPQTVRRFADDGRLRAVRLTERSPRRFVAEDVERLLERARGAAA
jgi:excisionase family DNA binding protein